MKQIYILFIFVFSSIQTALAQTGYKDEMGRDVSKAYFEQQILEGPFFGIPDGDHGKILVHRMPFGKVDPLPFFEKTGNLKALESGKSLIVIFYPGKDECNSSGAGDNAESFPKEYKTLTKWSEKGDAAPPVFMYGNPHGLEKYGEEVTWISDPEHIFQDQFFKYPYPCGSFVIIHPSGEYRAILGGYPLSQVQVALKKLNRAN